MSFVLTRSGTGRRYWEVAGLALPDDFSVGKMRYNRNAAETFYQLFTSALRNAPKTIAAAAAIRIFCTPIPVTYLLRR